MMPRRKPDEDCRRHVAEQASLWLERLERTLKGDEAAAFRNWLQVPLHREVIVERCTLWHGTEVLAVLGTLIPDDVALSRLPPRAGRTGFVLAWALTICIVSFSTYVLLGGRAPWNAFKVDKSTLRVEKVYRTPRDDRREVTLPDGASIAMNSATRVHVSYGGRERDAVLVHGEAVFDVPRDVRRPRFRVFVNRRIIETERARFNVRRLTQESSEITVVEGAVKILQSTLNTAKTPAQLRDPGSYSFTTATIFAPGAGVLEPGWQTISTLTPAQAQARLAWKSAPARR